MCTGAELFDRGCKAPLVYELEAKLAQITADAEGGVAEAAAYFRATNPTVKLHLTLEIFVRPGNNGAGVSPAAHDYTGETWQLTAYAQGNPEIALNDVFFDAADPPVATARPMPDSYEAESGIKVVRGVANLVGGQNPAGQLYIVRARWEPFDVAMTPEERDHWFALCEIKADRNELYELTLE